MIVKVVHIKVDNHIHIFILAKTDTNSQKIAKNGQKRRNYGPEQPLSTIFNTRDHQSPGKPIDRSHEPLTNF